MPTRLIVIALLCWASGCRDEPERRPAPDAGSVTASPRRPSRLSAAERATVGKVMDAREEIARIAETRSGDCDGAARDIAEVIERNRPLLAATAALERDPVKRQSIGDEFGARMLASSSKLMGLIESCDEHEGLARIFESLE